MSLYHLINGINPATFFLLPMIDKSPRDFPGFTDCFSFDKNKIEYKNNIHVYIKINNEYKKELVNALEKFRKDKNYITEYQDEFDTSYMMLIFSIPKNYKKDFKQLTRGNYSLTSKEYQQKVISTFPHLKENLEKFFNKS